VGSIVAQRAAAKLTPYTLELGGKNPVFVTPSADLSIAAKQCVWVGGGSFPQRYFAVKTRFNL
jgi:aldehyde dehydrogenase (NAD+)